MSKRSRTILTVSVRFPVPKEKGEKEALEEFKKIITNILREATIKLEKKETIYL